MGHALQNARGEFLSYRKDCGDLCFTDRPALARQYETEKGAKIARALLLRSFQREATPWQDDIGGGR